MTKLLARTWKYAIIQLVGNRCQRMKVGVYMIKLNDFAQEKGVSRQAIYKHLNKHKDILQEHIEKRGKNGTWLDDYACDFISNLMITNPVILGESKQQEEIEKLKQENNELKNKLIEVQNKGIQAVEQVSSMKDKIMELELKNQELQLMLENKPKNRRKWKLW